MSHGDHKHEIFTFISFILRVMTIQSKDTFCIISSLACYLRLKIPEETGESEPTCIATFFFTFV